MLKVQQFLQNGGTLDELVATKGIRLTYHKTDPLVILNYDQIESPRKDQISQECRGLCLELGTWEVVARSFFRFWNWGEDPETDALFDWESAVAQEKIDGSLIILYNYKDKWRVNTRGSFAEGVMCEGGPTWSDCFFGAIDKKGLNLLDKYSCYSFELGSPYNKVVRNFAKPELFLLTSFMNFISKECSFRYNNYIAEGLCVGRPKVYDIGNKEDVDRLIEVEAEQDKTFEGFVLKDKNYLRKKCKSVQYWSLHSLRGEGQNLFMTKYLLPWVVKGDDHELITYFPECKTRYYEVKDKVEVAKESVFNLWNKYKVADSQKEFAMGVKDNPLGAICFNARKKGQTIEEAWEDVKKDVITNKDSNLLLKRLFN